jgi:hypothetical protein
MVVLDNCEHLIRVRTILRDRLDWHSGARPRPSASGGSWLSGHAVRARLRVGCHFDGRVPRLGGGAIRIMAYAPTKLPPAGPLSYVLSVHEAQLAPTRYS